MSDRFRDLNISSFDLLPDLYRETDNGEAEDLCAALDDEYSIWDAVLDRFSRLPEADRCACQWLPHLAYRYGLRLPTVASIAAQRRLIGNAATMWRGKGGWQALKDVIFILTGLTCEIVALWSSPYTFAAGLPPGAGLAMAGPPYRRPLYQSWRAGLSQADLMKAVPHGAENQSQVYQFRIYIHREPTARELLLIIWAAKLLRRAQDHPILRWPDETLVWTIGYSKIGIDARVGPGWWRAGMSRASMSTIARAAAISAPTTHYMVPP